MMNQRRRDETSGCYGEQMGCRPHKSWARCCALIHRVEFLERCDDLFSWQHGAALGRWWSDRLLG